MAWFTLPLELHQKIYRYLRPVDLIRLARCSRYTYESTRAFTRVGNVDPAVLLDFWFGEDEIRLFRELQSETGFLVGGSAALWLMGMFDWWPKDLDCYIHGSRSSMLVDLLERFGYIEDADAADGHSHKGVAMRGFSHYPCPAALETLVFRKTMGGNERKIEVIATRYSPLHAILCSHSTVVMNFFSHSWAVSLYPNHTFIQENLLPLGGMCKVDEAIMTQMAVKKYEDRGFSTFSSILSAADALSRNSESSLFRRSAGDRFCWSIDLVWPAAWGVLSDSSSPGRKEVLQACSWSLVCEGKEYYLDTMPLCTSDDIRFTMDVARWQEAVLLRHSANVISQDKAGWPNLAVFDDFFRDCFVSLPPPPEGLVVPTGEAACRLWDVLRSVTSDNGESDRDIMPITDAEWWITDWEADSCRLAVKCYCDRKYKGTREGLGVLDSLGVDLEFLDISRCPAFV